MPYSICCAGHCPSLRTPMKIQKFSLDSIFLLKNWDASLCCCREKPDLAALEGFFSSFLVCFNLAAFQAASSCWGSDIHSWQACSRQQPSESQSGFACGFPPRTQTRLSMHPLLALLLREVLVLHSQYLLYTHLLAIQLVPCTEEEMRTLFPALLLEMLAICMALCRQIRLILLMLRAGQQPQSWLAQAQ